MPEQAACTVGLLTATQLIRPVRLRRLRRRRRCCFRCEAGRVVCFLRLSPPTLGLVRRRGRRGAQRRAGRGVCFSAPLATNFGLAKLAGGGSGGVRSWTGSLLLCASRRRLWAFPGLRDGESASHRLSELLNAPGLARRRWRRGPWTKSVLSTPLATDFGSMEAWLEGLLLPMSLAGPVSYLKNARLRHCLGCSVAYCA